MTAPVGSTLVRAHYAAGAHSNNPGRFRSSKAPGAFRVVPSKKFVGRRTDVTGRMPRSETERPQPPSRAANVI